MSCQNWCDVLHVDARGRVDGSKSPRGERIPDDAPRSPEYRIGERIRQLRKRPRSFITSLDDLRIVLFLGSYFDEEGADDSWY